MTFELQDLSQSLYSFYNAILSSRLMKIMFFINYLPCTKHCFILSTHVITPRNTFIPYIHPYRFLQTWKHMPSKHVYLCACTHTHTEYTFMHTYAHTCATHLYIHVHTQSIHSFVHLQTHIPYTFVHTHMHIRTVHIYVQTCTYTCSFMQCWCMCTSTLQAYIAQTSVHPHLSPMLCQI